MDPQLILVDCLEQLRLLPDRSIDVVLADLFYGITENLWDSVIEISATWEQFHCLCTGAVVLTRDRPGSAWADKPVEFAWLPNAGHNPELPSDRMVAQGGDVDWFRFWLESEENPSPAERE